MISKDCTGHHLACGDFAKMADTAFTCLALERDKRQNDPLMMQITVLNLPKYMYIMEVNDHKSFTARCNGNIIRHLGYSL